jgi:hypothetical protein
MYHIFYFRNSCLPLLGVVIVNFHSHHEDFVGNLAFSGSSFLLSILQTCVTRLSLPLPFIWKVMWHLTAKVLNRMVWTRRVTLDDHCPNHRRVSWQGLLYKMYWAGVRHRTDVQVQWIFCISSSPTPFISRHWFPQFENRDKTLSEGGGQDEDVQILKWIGQI